MDEPLEVEVIAHVLGSMDHCSHCQIFLDGVGVGQKIHQSDLDSFPEDWMDEWHRLSDLIYNITERYAGKLVIKITDAQSLDALWKAIRFGVRKYPTFLIGRDKYQGLEEQRVADLIEKHLPLAG
jgi:hypothetical protein